MTEVLPPSAATQPLQRILAGRVTFPENPRASLQENARFAANELIPQTHENRDIAISEATNLFIELNNAYAGMPQAAQELIHASRTLRTRERITESKERGRLKTIHQYRTLHLSVIQQESASVRSAVDKFNKPGVLAVRLLPYGINLRREIHEQLYSSPQTPEITPPTHDEVGKQALMVAYDLLYGKQYDGETEIDAPTKDLLKVMGLNVQNRKQHDTSELHFTLNKRIKYGTAVPLTAAGKKFTAIEQVLPQYEDNPGMLAYELYDAYSAWFTQMEIIRSQAAAIRNKYHLPKPDSQGVKEQKEVTRDERTLRVGEVLQSLGFGAGDLYGNFPFMYVLDHPTERSLTNLSRIIADPSLRNQEELDAMPGWQRAVMEGISKAYEEQKDALEANGYPLELRAQIIAIGIISALRSDATPETNQREIGEITDLLMQRNDITVLSDEDNKNTLAIATTVMSALMRGHQFNETERNDGIRIILNGLASQQLIDEEGVMQLGGMFGLNLRYDDASNEYIFASSNNT